MKFEELPTKLPGVYNYVVWSTLAAKRHKDLIPVYKDSMAMFLALLEVTPDEEIKPGIEHFECMIKTVAILGLLMDGTEEEVKGRAHTIRGHKEYIAIIKVDLEKRRKRDPVFNAAVKKAQKALLDLPVNQWIEG